VGFLSRLNQNDVLLQLMQQKNETYTMIDLILRFRFNADHALAEYQDLHSLSSNLDFADGIVSGWSSYQFALEGAVSFLPL